MNGGKFSQGLGQPRKKRWEILHGDWRKTNTNLVKISRGEYTWIHHTWRYDLVGGWYTYPSEKWWSSSDWIIIPTIGENKKCSKPPTRAVITEKHGWNIRLRLCMQGRCSAVWGLWTANLGGCWACLGATFFALKLPGLWWLGGFNKLEKYEFVNGKDDITYMTWKKTAMFETTNQLHIILAWNIWA